MLIGGYYPAVAGLGLCASEPERPWVTNALGAEWIGAGTATCGETVGCVQGGGDEDFFTNLQSCVNAAHPSVSREVSDAVRCLLVSFADGADAFEVCEEEISTCLAN